MNEKCKLFYRMIWESFLFQHLLLITFACSCFRPCLHVVLVTPLCVCVYRSRWWKTAPVPPHQILQSLALPKYSNKKVSLDHTCVWNSYFRNVNNVIKVNNKIDSKFVSTRHSRDPQNIQTGRQTWPTPHCLCFISQCNKLLLFPWLGFDDGWNLWNTLS